jgi:carbonic anhydrase/acetyltransferase-like protein (isoleucine patch superfamily)
MKRRLLSPCVPGLLVLLCCFQSMGQSVGVGTSTPHASSILDVSGTTGGLLVPRLTLAERDAIAGPAKGLVIFCSSDNSFYCFDGAWKRLAPAEHVWNLQGNSGTSSLSHFIGTKDTAALAFAVNNIPLLRLYPNGRLHLDAAGNNTMIGSLAGSGNLGGNANVFLGGRSGENNESGDGNTFVGMFSGNNNLGGHYNTYLGLEAGRMNMAGSDNLMVGAGAGHNNNGGQNTFIGRAAGHSASGNFLHFVGYLAGRNNTTGESNHFSGYRAGTSNTTGSFNYFSGHDAGHSNLEGIANVFVGYAAGYSNATGTENLAMGPLAGFNSNGHKNVFFGFRTGFDNTTGSYNTFVGHQSGLHNTTGADNTFIGISSGLSNTTGSSNYFGGYNAGVMNTTGSGNTFGGYSSGSGNTTGSNNTLIGMNADVTSGNLTNAGAIGYNAKVSQSNSFVIGGTGADAVRVGIGITAPVTTLHVNGTVSGIGPYINLSDSRVKTNILPVTNALTGILQLQAVSYDWKKEAYPQFKFDDKRQIGFLAQELEKIFPEAVSRGEDGFYTVSYSSLVPVIIQGMKEQQAQADAMKEEIRQLKNTIELLMKKIETNQK